MTKVSYKRHLLKSITWRVLGTLDTILLSWLITGDPMMGLKIGFTEVGTKMLLYYLHERVWIKINLKWDVNKSKYFKTQTRHLLKTVSWRAVGSLDTLAIGWYISGNPLSGLKIGMAEVATKMTLYYLHERVWYKIDYGLDRQKG